MENKDAPIPMVMNQEIFENIIIEQDSAKYNLHLSSIGDNITFNLEYDSNNYVKKTSLKEIKDKESNAIFLHYSCKDFIEFLKSVAQMKKLSIITMEKNLIIRFEAPILFKVHIIEIELLNMEQYQLNNELEKLKQEKIELNKKIEELELKHDKEINELKNEINELRKNIRTNKSVIMQDNEFELIRKEIEKKMNLKVKELKKLYQASFDGDSAINFHSRCDGIKNTLVLIKSAGNRRFGGFNSQVWTSAYDNYTIDDKNAFLFSLDKKKIYHYNNNGYSVYSSKDHGPCFGYLSNDIRIGSHCIYEKELYTQTANEKCSFDYGGDKNALAENIHGCGVLVLDYEVFFVVLGNFID